MRGLVCYRVLELAAGHDPVRSVKVRTAAFRRRTGSLASAGESAGATWRDSPMAAKEMS